MCLVMMIPQCSIESVPKLFRYLDVFVDHFLAKTCQAFGEFVDLIGGHAVAFIDMHINAFPPLQDFLYGK